MKKVFVLVLSIFAMFGLTACVESGSDESNEVTEVLDSISVATSVSDDFTLTVAKDNVLITWTSNNDAIKVSGANATVTQEVSDVTVTLTASGEKGDVKGTKEFSVKVLAADALPVTTIGDALQSVDGTKVELAHVTVLKSYSSGTHFTDGVNAIYVYGTKDLTVGDSYSLEATKATYGGSPQLSTATVTKLDNVTTHTLTPTVATVAEINAVSSGLDYKFYSVTGTYNASSTTLVDGTDMIGISSYSLSSATTLLKAYDGLEITLELFITGGYKNYKEVLIYTTQEDLDNLTFDDETVLESALNNLSLPSTTMNNLDLVTDGLLDSTISWSSSDEAIISSTGVVTRQSVDTTVTLTATASLNGKTKSKTFDVVVISSEQTVSTDLFISEYFRGNSNDKYVEVYNPSAYDVDLSEYKLVQANNANTFESVGTGYHVQLTGTLGAGETFVIYHNSTSTAVAEVITANAGIALASTSSFMGFNNDDGIGLFKNGILVDMIGYETQTSIVIGDISTGYICATRKIGYGASATFDTDEWSSALGRESIDGANTSVNYEGAGSHTFEADTTVINIIALVNKESQLSL